MLQRSKIHKHYNIAKFSTVFATFFLPLALPFSAMAGGYEVEAHSAEGMGVSNAGASSGYSDGSALYFNPAAITALESTTFSASVAYLALDVKARNNNSTSLLGTPLEGGSTENEVSNAFIPSLYFVHPISDKLSAGIFMVSPFGLGSEFDHDWVGRYQAVKSELTTIQTGVGAAYKVTDSFSLGASLSSIYADATLTNSIDFGSIGVATLGAPTASALGLSSQQNDGFVKLDGSDWAMGWAAGAAYSYGQDKRNRIGVAYRASSQLNIHGGSAKFDVPTEALPLTSTGAFTNTSASTSITLPEAISIGATHWLSDDWTLLYESKWTRWSRFDRISIGFANPAQPTQVEEEQWNNAWRHSLGVRHALSSEWSVSSGFAFDECPISSSENRTARIPESDQYWGSLGLKYQMSEHSSWNLAYQHVWLNDGVSQRVGAAGDTLNATWDNGYDDVALGYTYSF